MDSIELNETFETSGETYGFSKVTAEYMPYRDFAVKWSRTGTKVDFTVTDYMEAAPPEAMFALADTIFAKIRGKEVEYPQAMIDWITSRDFLRANRQTYIQRCDNLSEDARGKHIDMNEVYDRLVGDGLVKRDPDIELRWMKSKASRAADVSVMMKTVMVNRKLDIEDLPETTIDFVLLKQLRQIERGVLRNRYETEIPTAAEAVAEKEASMELKRFKLKL